MNEKYKRSEWFRGDRFGMFIHWGLYAIPARGEWIRNRERLTIEDYEPFFRQFDPVDYDPREWARIAKQAGMKYAILTAKHHDGFCLFDSKLTDYKATNTPAGRDLVREFLDAFRAEGLKVGLYYSVIDWHHPSYPAYGDRTHPMRANPEYAEREPWENYVEYMHGQVKELCTEYGKIDIMWFDFSYDEMTGEKWEATRLINMIRQYQPHMITDNRLEVSGEGFGSLLTNNPNVYSGDFTSPEQIIPPKGILDCNGDPAPWEACITLNDNWGYCANDFNYKTPDIVIRKLVECVSKGGNMLLNVGPDARGRIPAESIEILESVGEWMADYSESIYNCGICDLDKPEWGRYTAKDKTIYAHVYDPPVGPLALPGIKGEEVDYIRFLRDGTELKLYNDWRTGNYPDVSYVDIGPYVKYDAVDTVVKIVKK